MELGKNYPWTKSFKVSEEDFKKWQSEGSGKSFVFWSLQKKLINPKLYFDWAVEHYQIPFVEEMFFEQHLMKKRQWDKIKDLADWTEEILPVAVHDETVFIGCVEPKEQNFEFKHCFVLVSNKALETMWKFTQGLTSSLKQDEETRSQSLKIALDLEKESEIIDTQTNSNTKTVNQPITNTKTNYLSKDEKTDLKMESPLEKEPPLSQPVLDPNPVQPLSQEDKKANNVTGLKLETSLEKEPPLSQPVLEPNPVQPLSQENKKTNNVIGLKMESPLEKEPPLSQPVLEPNPVQPLSQANKKTNNVTKSKSVKINSEVLKAESMPEPEEERVVEQEHNTSPGRAPQEDDYNNNLIMGNFKAKSSVKSTEGKADLTISRVAIARLNPDFFYKKLWKQTQFAFTTTMVLEVKDNKIYPLAWSGKMRVEDSSKELVSLKDYSLFKVIQKGHPYHGFVVQLPANKEFFNKIGWKDYPEHITAIPIENEKKELEKIFVGLGMNSLHRNKITEIEKIVFDFFKSHSQKMPKVA